MTTIEEMARTFREHGLYNEYDGLRAVIEKHIGPMIAEAIEAHHAATIRCQALTDGPCDCMTPQDRAARIISDLTAPDPISRIADETESSDE